jgi:hypothetical protein
MLAEMTPTERSKRICACKHSLAEHEDVGHSMIVCLHFEKGLGGNNLSVCSCKNYEEVRVR